MSEIAPGWYKDPAEPSTQRYWDGEGWVGDPLPADALPPPGPPRSAAPLRAAAQTQPPVQPPAPSPVQPTQPGTAPPPRNRPIPTPTPTPGAAWPPGAPLEGVPLPPGVHWVGGMPYVLARPRPHGLPLAPLGLRLLARLIDFGVVFALNLVANSLLIYLFISDLKPWARAVVHVLRTGVEPQTTPVIPDRIRYFFALIPLVIVVLWLVYEVPAIAQSGQTYGKRVVGIKVVGLESTEPLGFARALRRWNPLALPVLLWTCGVGFLLQLVDSLSPLFGGPLRLALHDRSAATVVVHSGRKGHEITPDPIPEQTGEPS